MGNCQYSGRIGSEDMGLKDYESEEEDADVRGGEVLVTFCKPAVPGTTLINLSELSQSRRL